MASEPIQAAQTSKKAPKAVIEHQLTPFERFLETNRKLLIWLCLLAALVAVAWLLVTYLQRKKQAAQNEALGNAKDAAGYRDVISKHPGSAAAGSARLLLAEALWKDGKKDESYQELKAFVDSAKDHPLYAKGLSDLGLQEHVRGNLDEAINLLEQATAKDVPDFARLPGLLRLGDARVAKGLEAVKKNDLDAAKKIFEEARVNYEDLEAAGQDSFKAIVKSRKDRLPHLSVPAKKAPEPAPAAPAAGAAAPPAGDPAAVPPVPPAGGEATTPPVAVPPAETPPTAPPPAVTPPPAAETPPAAPATENRPK